MAIFIPPDELAHYMDHSKVQTFGLFVSEDVKSYLSEFAHDRAGVVSLDSYVDISKGSLPEGDPLGNLFTDMLEIMLDQFEWLYYKADFKHVQENVSPDSFSLIHIAGDSRLVNEWDSWIEGIRTVEGCDTRVAQTAILKAAIDENVFDSHERIYG